MVENEIAGHAGKFVIGTVIAVICLVFGYLIIEEAKKVMPNPVAQEALNNSEQALGIFESGSGVTEVIEVILIVLGILAVLGVVWWANA